ncbi:hypothetical protein [uncultured Paracoccus sp.]|uniref:hypothetical protein n=1 Tax=uncultured Paracoccus sp. TaxID=189685 RepID=UPI0025EE030C|nr:hypothetical protein [uncultured Paracoccus sp.]
MFDDQDTDRLIAAMRSHGVTTLEIETDGAMLRLVLPAQAAPPPASTPKREAARSRDIGAFLPRGGDDGLTALGEGDGVQAGEVLGYVARGPVRVAVTAPVSGRVAGAPPTPGTILGFGDTVLEIEQP